MVPFKMSWTGSNRGEPASDVVLVVMELNQKWCWQYSLFNKFVGIGPTQTPAPYSGQAQASDTCFSQLNDGVRGVR
jgi:hypothetical protein